MIPHALVKKMHAAYRSGLSLSETARRYGRSAASLRGLFESRNLPIRKDPRGKARRGSDGRIMPVRLSEFEIIKILAGAKNLRMPKELLVVWRHWDLPRRADIVARLKAVLRIDGWRGMPETPCSENVRPFVYGTPEAHAIAQKLNAGLSSHRWKTKLGYKSEGLIWNGRLWFWCGQGTGYAAAVEGRRLKCGAAARQALHHAVYEKHHGVMLPHDTIIRMKDGNWNNLDPSNLVSGSRKELGLENVKPWQQRRREERDADQFFQLNATLNQLSKQCPAAKV